MSNYTPILDPADFAHFGELKEAGMEAARVALIEQKKSFDNERVPINGAVVSRLADGTLKVVSVGRNARIPPRDAKEGSEFYKGYPTDHGETGCVRQIEDFRAVDWPNSVFVTTLFPCIMCVWTVEDLHAHGLRHCVILDSSFEGGKKRLETLSDMKFVCIQHPDSVSRMMTFGRRYPWDWNADIGAIPPRQEEFDAIIAKSRAEGSSWLSAREEGEAAVIGPDFKLLSAASDGAQASFGNSCRSSVICAMGKAGSSVNLRECAVVWRSEKGDLEAFGRSSIGACQLFRPAVLVTYPIERSVSEHLEAAGIVVVQVPRCGTKRKAEDALQNAEETSNTSESPHKLLSLVSSRCRLPKKSTGGA
jgi:tRNA(Arg) A34 adenosine deaminase TadA